MQQKYISHLREAFLKNPKKLFFQFLEGFEIKELKKFPDFEQLKKDVMLLALDPQKLFKTACLAIKKGKLASLEFLIDECGYNLKGTVGKDNISILHEACLWGCVEIVEYLLKKGFDPNQKNQVGSTPLHFAIQSPKQKRSSAIIMLLKAHGADLNALETSSKLSPLHLAATCKNNFAQK